MQRHPVRDDLCQGLTQRWPAHGHNRVRDRRVHERDRLAQQEDLDLMCGLREPIFRTSA